MFIWTVNKIGKPALRESNMRTYWNGDIVGANGDRPDKINEARSDRNPSILPWPVWHSRQRWWSREWRHYHCSFRVCTLVCSQLLNSCSIDCRLLNDYELLKKFTRTSSFHLFCQEESLQEWKLSKLESFVSCKIWTKFLLKKIKDLMPGRKST